MVLKSLEKIMEGLLISGRIKTIQTTAQLKSVRKLRRDLRKLVVAQTLLNDHLLKLGK